MRRKMSILLASQLAAIFVIALVIGASFFDNGLAPNIWESNLFVLRLMVVGVALAVLGKRAVSARLMRHFPHLPMMILLVASCFLFAADAYVSGFENPILVAHSILILGLVMLIATMPFTLIELLLVLSPVLVVMGAGSVAPLQTGVVPLEILLMCLVPLAGVAAMLQLYRTLTASHEIAIDPLTGCYSRAFGMEMIRLMFEGAVRKGAHFALAFIDLDDFKKINDRYGHEYGDHILREVGGSLVSRFRGSDLVVRWGGEEFVVLLPDLTATEAREVIERVMAPGLANLKKGALQRASVGLAERIEDGIGSSGGLIDLADQRMYDEKSRYDRDDVIVQGLSGVKSSVGGSVAVTSPDIAPASQSVN
ncbi:GGDEF domain-containing protein [Thalassospira sp. MA62]|nr:GGDEF domain-containing protein [Thalassospira sp. MA62]